MLMKLKRREGQEELGFKEKVKKSVNFNFLKRGLIY